MSNQFFQTKLAQAENNVVGMQNSIGTLAVAERPRTLESLVAEIQRELGYTSTYKLFVSAAEDIDEHVTGLKALYLKMAHLTTILTNPGTDENHNNGKNKAAVEIMAELNRQMNDLTR